MTQVDDGITISHGDINRSDAAPLGNGTKPAKAPGPGLDVEGQGGATEAIVPLNSLKRSMRRASGPRTELGKQRTSLNATRHGIFSRVSVLKGESRARYESLLKGLRESLQPVGKLEEILVEKLATILWRHRRLVMAEAAEIRNGTEFFVWDERNQQQQEAEEIASSSMLDYEGGLIRKIQSPHVLERCLELLAELRQGIEKGGFAPERDTAILRKIYGDRGKGHLRETLYDDYAIWVGTSRVSEEEREREGYATPEQCKRIVLKLIDAEVRFLKRYRKAGAAIEVDRTSLEMLRRSIPESPSLDRLLRYEASLERAFDRTLSQLERLQRMRLGQPVLPPVRVEVSG
jgi:hypothetical protein